MAQGNVVELRINQPANFHDLLVTGELPIGNSTENIPYFILDTSTNSVIGQVTLPRSAPRRMAVSLTVKVSQASGSYAIGTFGDEGGFQASEFLSVHDPNGTERPG